MKTSEIIQEARKRLESSDGMDYKDHAVRLWRAIGYVCFERGIPEPHGMPDAGACPRAFGDWVADSEGGVE